MATAKGDSATRLTLPQRMRLAHARQYAAVRRDGVRLHVGPLSIVAAANGLPHPRLGLSIARRVGAATKRNRLKRHIRESFRLLQHEFSAGYDLIVSARPHELLEQSEYQQHLARVIAKLDQTWQSRRRKRDSRAP